MNATLAHAPMRPWLRWTLIVTLLLSVIAIAWPSKTAQAVAQVADRTAERAKALAPATTTVAAESVVSPLPAMLPTHFLDKATFDPFAGVQPPPPPAPEAEKPLMGPLQPAPVARPALNYRYLGQFTDPSGKRSVYLSRADKDITVEVGAKLDEGYTVEAIGPDGIRLYYPPLRAHASIPIPAAAQDSTSLAFRTTP